MIQSFIVRQSFYVREGSVTYNGIAGSLWVLWRDHRFCGRTFVAGKRPTRSRVIESFDTWMPRNGPPQIDTLTRCDAPDGDR